MKHAAARRGILLSVQIECYAMHGQNINLPVCVCVWVCKDRPSGTFLRIHTFQLRTVHDLLVSPVVTDIKIVFPVFELVKMS